MVRKSRLLARSRRSSEPNEARAQRKLRGASANSTPQGLSLLLMNAMTFGVFAALFFAPFAGAQTQVSVPAWRCDSTNVYANGFEQGDALVPIRPSMGNGGMTGSSSIALSTPAGPVNYHLSVPSDYAGEALPLLIGLHGAGGPGTQALAATRVRDTFTDTLTYNTRFIGVAPESSGLQGGWVPSTDLIKLRAVIADVGLRFNVDQNRTYGWGFSAGGQMMHIAALSDPNFVASYGAHAGRLPTSGSGTPETSTRIVPVLLTHGFDDEVVPFSVAQSDRLRFLNSGWSEGENGNFLLRGINIPHTYETFTILQSWFWSCRYALVP